MGKSAKDWKDEAKAFEDQDDFERAIECYDKALKLDPEDAYSWYCKGLLIAYSSGKYDDAIKCFSQAIELNPEYEKAWRDKGQALISLERYEDAIECYNEAVKLNPEDSDAWAGKGGVLAALWETALEDENSDSSPSKGGTLPWNGKSQDAMKCIDKAIELDSQNFVAWGYKASLSNSLGKYDDALKCINKALEIDPEDQGILRIKEEIMQSHKNNAQDIQDRRQKLEYEIKNLNQERSKKCNEAGKIVYSKYKNNEPNFTGLSDIRIKWYAIMAIDSEIDKINREMEALNSRGKKSGFFAKMGDLISTTAKQGKSKIDLYSLGKKKDNSITEFGEQLYMDHKKGTITFEELSGIWQGVGELETQVNAKEDEISHL